MSEMKAYSATGNQMVAEALRQVDPDVMAAYPITPQTTIVENFAKYVADGLVHTELVDMESEHSALSACIGSSCAGARVATATASQGLAYMWEELHIAAGMRCPIVMANANRTLSAPINIHCDHSDIMGARDTGWIIFFAETAQEAYDNTILAFKIAEDPRVLLPVMPTLDGFITSHAMERCVKEEDAVVKQFVGEYVPAHPLLDADNPVGHGMFANLGPVYMKTRRALRTALEGSLDVIKEHGATWAEISGRPFDVVDTWGTQDADYVVVVLGSTAGNCRHVARELRAEGKKVGVVRPRIFRPFPYEEVAQACKNARAVAVMDRSDSLGAQFGPLGLEVMAALAQDGNHVPVKDFIFGLGGNDITNELVREVFEKTDQVVSGNLACDLEYLGIEE